MTTQETLVAARDRAERGIAGLLSGRTFDDDTAATVAAEIRQRLEADGWHHRSEHTAAPPKPEKSEPPSAEYLEARARLNQREEHHE